MKIYVDLVLFTNFSVNFIFLYLIQLIFNDQIKWLRIILSSVIASIMIFMFLVDYYIFYLFKICGGVILVLIGVGYNKFVIKLSLFYILLFSLTGLITSFNINDFYLIIAIFIIAILIMIQSFKKACIFNNQLKYNVSVTFSGKVINMNGFLDTGNLIMEKNIPIIFLDYKYFQEDLEVFSKIKIKTVSDEKEILCYLPDAFSVYINKKKINKTVLVAFTNLDRDIDCLLNFNIFI